jgi:ATP-dependent 26S proteasome regulatory subunit
MTKPRARKTEPEALRDALRKLDQFLASALQRAEAEFGAQGAMDAMRGLHLAAEDVRRAVRGASGMEPMGALGEEIVTVLRCDARFGLLIRLHRLTVFEALTLLIALAPEVDLRYQRIFGYLQDDVTRKRPTVDLVLSLLCSSDAQRHACRAQFAGDGKLFRSGLLELIPDPHYAHPPLLALYVKPDEQIVRFLLADTGFDSRLIPSCRLVQPRARVADLFIPEGIGRELAQAHGMLWLHGPRGIGKGTIAEALAHEAAAPLIVLDAARVSAPDVETVLSVAQREALLRGSHLYVEHADSWINELRAVRKPASCTTIFGAMQPPPAELLGLVRSVEIPLPCAAQRAACWRKALSMSGRAVSEEAVARLGRRFRLTPAQIFSAASIAGTDVFAGARAQGGDDLRSAADRVVPRATWADIVLPSDAMNQLRELCERVEWHERVFDEWGFDRKLSRGRGTTALFSGGSGTGKTMAAEVIASALGLDLYRIDLARVVSKYIGETEKNLDRVFKAAAGANAVLLFDEADALFGKRSEVKDAHDRYANIEVAYLLQKMEEYEGVGILATNLADHLDEAFTRRLAFHVYFPFPDEAARLEIWQRAWPAETPVAASVDRATLARELRFAGGSIRNVALAAAFAAAGNGGIVDLNHIRHAARREQQKSGRSSALPRSLAEHPT